MVDYIEQLYNMYCEDNDDLFASEDNAKLKNNMQEIDKTLSSDLYDKLCEIQIADSRRAFRCGFTVAMQIAMQVMSEVVSV